MIENNEISTGNIKSPKSIDKLLSEKNTTLEDLLKYENLLEEFNIKNEKLLNFFNKEKIKYLINYIIKDPQINENEIETEESKNKGYKYPFLCSQIFGLEIDELFKYFFMTNKQIDEYLQKEKISVNDNKKDNNEKEKILQDENNKEEYNETIIKIKEFTQENENNKIEIKNECLRNNNDDKNKLLSEKKEDNNCIKYKEEKLFEETSDIKSQKEILYKNEGKSENMEDRIELIDYLFTFFPQKYDENKKLNYVLCGYFSQLIANLLDYNPTTFLKYLYSKRKDVFFLMESHCYRKSISDALSKLMQIENYFKENTICLDDEMKNSMNETRIDILRDLFSSLNINMDNEKLNSIFFFLIGLFGPTSIYNEKYLFQKMINDDNIINSLIYKPLFNLDLISNNDEGDMEIKKNNFIIIIDIIIFLLKIIQNLELDMPTCTSNDSILSIKHSKLSQEIFEILPNLIEINFNKINNKEKKILQSFNEYQLEPLGEYKIKIVDLICNLIPYFKNISKYFDEILINTHFFKNGFKYIFEYEWNNLYQESFLILLKSFLDNSANHELLFNYLFNNLKVFELIKFHINNKNRFQFINEISSDISHGYQSFLISLSYKINTIIGGTPLGVNTNPSTEGSFEFLPKPEENNDYIDSITMINNNEDQNKNLEKKEEYNEQKKGTAIESMKKYLNEDWKLFFKDKISDIIKQYCDKNWPKREKDLDIFDFLFQENNDDENKEEEENNKNNMNDNIEINNKETKNDITEEKDELNTDGIKTKNETEKFKEDKNIINKDFENIFDNFFKKTEIKEENIIENNFYNNEIKNENKDKLKEKNNIEKTKEISEGSNNDTMKKEKKI